MRHAVLILIAVATGCIPHSHDHPHDQSHDHSHDTHSHGVPEAPSLVFTLYTERTELFVEFPPLVVNEETRFAAHFTSLGQRFAPISTGSVTLTLRDDAGTQTSVIADAPDVPGIFLLSLVPEKPGRYELVFDLHTPEYRDEIRIDEITVYADNRLAQQAQAKTAPPAEGEITFLKEQAWKTDFAALPVHRDDFHQVVKTTGLVTTVPGAEQTVSARTAGIVAFSGSAMLAGTPVSRGQHLFTISSRGFTDGSIPLKMEDARFALERAEADYRRVQGLLDDRLVTQQEYLQTRQVAESARAVYENLTAHYRVDGQRIVAIQSGFLKAVLVSPGQYVETGHALAVISDTKRLTVRADLSQSAFARINGVITSANFRVAHDLVYTLAELNGKLQSIGTFADNSLYIPIWFEIDNRAGILPGMYLEMFLKSQPVERALLIPLTAVMEEQGYYYCYVQTGGESFTKREIVLGGNDGYQVHVLSGVQEGERIVTKGAYLIKLSAASGALPEHGHAH